MVVQYTKEDVNKALKEVLEDERSGGLYAPLLDRLAIYIDDEVPPAIQKEMAACNGAPMAASNVEMKLWINREALWKDLNELDEMYRAEWKKKHSYGVHILRLKDEVRNMLIHEFTHLLCQHTQRQKIMFKKYHNPDGSWSIPRKEFFAFRMACEIEANRGYGIMQDGSTVYWGGVTDDSPYPKTKSVKYLRDIYEVLLREYGEQMEQDYDEGAKQIIQQMIQQGKSSGGENGQGGQKGEKENGEENPGNQGGGQPTNEGGGQEGKDGQGGGEGQQTNEGSSQSGAAQRRQRMLAKALMDPANQYEGMKFDPNFDAHNQGVITLDDTGLNPHGVGGGNIDGVDFTAEQVLRSIDAEYSTKVVENALTKVKGSIVGTIAKERVPTYSRQARRDTSDGLLKKGSKRSSRSCPKILVALDKSGSMDTTTIRQATEAVSKVFDITGRPTQGCWICLHDGIVKHVRPFKQWKEVVSHYYPGGGNDFGEVVKKANKLGVDIVLNVGDGGDRVCRDKKAAKEFLKAGRRWIDVNISKEASRERQRDWMVPVYADDWKACQVMREMADLTGQIEIDPEYVKSWAERYFSN